MRLREEGCQELSTSVPLCWRGLDLQWPGAESGQALVCNCLCLGSVAQLGFRYLKVSFPGERRVFLS